MNKLTPYQNSLLDSMALNPNKTVISNSNNVDLSDIFDALIDEKGNLRCLPSYDLLSFGFDRLRLFAHHKGIYQFPTLELLNVLTEIIGENTCVEIGAGRGDIGRNLGIKITDSHQQNDPQYRKLYEASGQPTIKYPFDVEKLAYKDAIKKYRPSYVLGCWITHRYDPKRHDAGGNVAGIDASFVVQRTKKFIFVGNTEIHKNWRIPEFSKQDIFTFDGIVSRTSKGQNFVMVLEKAR